MVSSECASFYRSALCASLLYEVVGSTQFGFVSRSAKLELDIAVDAFVQSPHDSTGCYMLWHDAEETKAASSSNNNISGVSQLQVKSR